MDAGCVTPRFGVSSSSWGSSKASVGLAALDPSWSRNPADELIDLFAAVLAYRPQPKARPAPPACLLPHHRRCKHKYGGGVFCVENGAGNGPLPTLPMRFATFLLHPLAAVIIVVPAAARADCRVRFLPGNSLGQPAGRIEVAHGRNDSPGVKFFLVSRGGIAPFADVTVLDDACRFLPQKLLD